MSTKEEKYRGFKIVSDGTFCLNKITTIGKGTVVDMLKGSYTSVGTAKQTIDRYFEREDSKNAKTKANSRS